MHVINNRRLKSRAKGWRAPRVWVYSLTISVLFAMSGCKAPVDHRKIADDVAYDIIKGAQLSTLGKTEDMKIIQPSDVFRRKLIESQGLTYSEAASLGRDKLATSKLWPDDEYLKAEEDADYTLAVDPNEPVKLSMIDALMIGAANNFDFQAQKESIFQAALDLDLQKQVYRTTFSQVFDSEFITNRQSSLERVESTTQTLDSTISKKFENGIEVSAGIAVNLANLLTQGGASAIGMSGDVSVSMPLLRGSGKHIITESLTQAERNVVYAIYNFERYKRQFVVNVVNRYLGVLVNYDQIKNSEENYRSLVVSVRRASRMSEAGEMSEIEVDQAYQNQLSARNRWISAIQSYNQSLDEFKIFLGLPTDANIELDRDELSNLYAISDQWGADESTQQEETGVKLPADAPIELPDFTKSKGGPLEIESELATAIAFENRCDLKVTQGKLEDDKRWVIVKADALGAELTIGSSVTMGGSRNGAGADTKDILIETDRAKFMGWLTLDLPFERTQERNDYRKSLIALEASMRDLRSLEDDIKLSVRNGLRELISARESVRIQVQSVMVAEKRVDSGNKFLEKGRASIRDVLESQESLLSAQNSLTNAIKNYRITELQLQRDMGVLEVNEKGIFKEIEPEVLQNAG